MSVVEVVVASMQQSDWMLLDKMNIQSDIVIANQAGKFGYEETDYKGNRAKMLTTATHGVGRNRNFGLEIASGSILLLADDDIQYFDGYAKCVEDAFVELPQADVIIFRMQFVRQGEVYDVDNHRTRRLHMWNGLGFGTYQIAIRRTSLLQASLHFTSLFGGGCIYSAGEDSLFLIDCFRNGLSVYSHTALLGNNVRDSSTWFSGFTRKFFFDRGAFAACAFPHTRIAVCLYYLYAYKKTKTLKNTEKLALMMAGCSGFSRLLTYDEWKK